MKINLNWNDKNYGESSINVYRSTSTIDPANLPAPLATLSPGTTTYSDTTATTGTIYYYRVAAIIGGTAYVSSELQIDAVITGITGAVEFDGSSQKVTVPSLTLSSAFTVEAMIDLISDSDYTHVFSGSNQGTFAFKVGSASLSRKPYFYTSTTGSKVGTTQLVKNTWYRLSLTYDGTNLKIYVNGVIDSTFAISGLSISASTFQINGVNSEYNNVKQSDTRVWTIARTAAQIDGTKYSRLLGTETGLLLYYKMDETSGTTLADSAGTHDGTIVNGITFLPSEQVA